MNMLGCAGRIRSRPEPLLDPVDRTNVEERCLVSTTLPLRLAPYAEEPTQQVGQRRSCPATLATVAASTRISVVIFAARYHACGLVLWWALYR